MNYETIMSIIKQRRTMRHFNTEPASEENVLKVLEAARWAPSGNNSQPWEFVVVREKNKLSQCIEILLEQNRILREKSLNFRYANKDYLRRVTTLIFVCGDPRFKQSYPQSNASEELAKMYKDNTEAIYFQSVTAAICNILMAATSLGMATVWITGTHESIIEKQLRAALNIPEMLDIICCIPLGYSPDKRPSLRTPRPLENIVHFDTFDKNKCRTDHDVEKFIKNKQVRAEFYKTGGMLQK